MAKRASDATLDKLRKFGLAYPGAHSKSPWPGHDDLAVNDKTFAYLTVAGEPFAISCKLPVSSAVALMLPFVEPAPYGLGKSGWVRAEFPQGEPPFEMLKEWIDESYRAQAPKKLVAQLAAAGAPPAARSAQPARGAKPTATPRAKPAATTRAKPAATTRTKPAATTRAKPAARTTASTRARTNPRATAGTRVPSRASRA